MRYFTLFIIASLIAASFAADELCNTHPLAKRKTLERLAQAMNAATNTDVKAVLDQFGASSTATASTAFSATVHALVPEAWRTADAKTCCTDAIYASLTKIPDVFIQFVRDNESDFIKVLAGLTKGIGNCGKRKAPKGVNGTSIDIEQVNALELLSRIKVPSATPGTQEVNTIDANVTVAANSTTLSGNHTAPSQQPGAKFGIEYLKDYYVNKAKIIVSWVQFNRGNLFFFCRLPSAAKAALKGAAETGAIQVGQTSWDELVKTYKEALTAIRTSLGGFAEVIKFAFRAFGEGQKCESAAKKILNELSKVGPCGKGNCTSFFESGIKPRPLDFRLIKFLIGKPGQNPQFEGNKLDERPSGTTSPFAAQGSTSGGSGTGTSTGTGGATGGSTGGATGGATGGKLRVLQTTEDEPEPATVAQTDANAVTSIKLPSDSTINGGGPYKADGTCFESGCDAQFAPQTTAQFNEEGAVTTDGKPTNQNSGAASSASLLSLGTLLIAIISIIY